MWKCLLAVLTLVTIGCQHRAADDPNLNQFRLLFPADGPPSGWLLREWSDLSRLVSEEFMWTVKDGILQSGKHRGTWLISQKTYGDFVLEFEFKLTEYGNSGVALRAPLYGDPAFDGLEMQLADVRYSPRAKDSELTGAIYRAIAPSKQVYKPTEWNGCRIELKGARLKVTMNGEVIQDTDLSQHNESVARHDGSAALPIRQRPREGHIGFQHLSRGSEPVLIRGARIMELR